MSEVQFRKHTAGVIAALEAGDKPVGDGEAPTDTAAPYLVVYPIPGGTRSGNLDDPFGDAELIYQVTCVGTSRNQAEWLADAAEALLLAGVSVTGRRVRVVPHTNPGVTRNDNVTPPLFEAKPRYRLMTTPS